MRSRSGEGLYVYADDFSAHGMRILNDLTPWIAHHAPAEFDLLILLERSLTGQETYVTNELKNRARRSSKTARVRWWCNEQFARADASGGVATDAAGNEQLVAFVGAARPIAPITWRSAWLSPII